MKQAPPQIPPTGHSDVYGRMYPDLFDPAKAEWLGNGWDDLGALFDLYRLPAGTFVMLVRFVSRLTGGPDRRAKDVDADAARKFLVANGFPFPPDIVEKPSALAASDVDGGSERQADRSPILHPQPKPDDIIPEVGGDTGGNSPDHLGAEVDPEPQQDLPTEPQASEDSGAWDSTPPPCEVQITVYEGDQLRGFFDLAKSEYIDEAGTSAGEVAEFAEGWWEELRRLPNGEYVLVERSWDEFTQTQYGKGRLLSRVDALAWLAANNIRPPAEFFAEMGLVDFNVPTVRTGGTIPPSPTTAPSPVTPHPTSAPAAEKPKGPSKPLASDALKQPSRNRKRPGEKAQQTITAALRKESKSASVERIKKLTGYKVGTLKHYLPWMVNAGQLIMDEGGWKIAG